MYLYLKYFHSLFFIMSFDFNLEKKPQSRKSPSSSSKTKTSSTKTASRGNSNAKAGKKRGKSSKGLDPNVMLFGGIGAVVLLIIAVACCFMGEGGGSSGKMGGLTKREHLDRAYSYNSKGNYNKALEEFKIAYKMDPTDGYAPDQISIIYRNNLHDNGQAEHWKNISNNIISNAVDSNRGASAKAYAEKKSKKEARKKAGSR